MSKRLRFNYPSGFATPPPERRELKLSRPSSSSLLPLKFRRYKLREKADYIKQIQREILAAEAAFIIYAEIKRIRNRHEIIYDTIPEEDEEDPVDDDDCNGGSDDDNSDESESVAWESLFELVMELEEEHKNCDDIKKYREERELSGANIYGEGKE